MTFVTHADVERTIVVLSAQTIGARIQRLQGCSALRRLFVRGRRTGVYTEAAEARAVVVDLTSSALIERVASVDVIAGAVIQHVGKAARQGTRAAPPAARFTGYDFIGCIPHTNKRVTPAAFHAHAAVTAAKLAGISVQCANAHQVKRAGATEPSRIVCAQFFFAVYPQFRLLQLQVVVFGTLRRHA